MRTAITVGAQVPPLLTSIAELAQPALASLTMEKATSDDTAVAVLGRANPRSSTSHAAETGTVRMLSPAAVPAATPKASRRKTERSKTLSRL